MLDDLLILGLDLVKELAKHRQLLLGRLNDPGDLRLHGGGALGSGYDLAEALVGLAHDAHALVQGLLGGLDAAAELSGPGFHIAYAGIHLSGQLLDFLGQLLYLGGHHGEAPALHPGPGRLDGGVDGQDVGLVGDGDDFPHALLDAPDGGLKVSEDVRHLVVGRLDFRGGVFQLLHQPLGLEDRAADFRPDVGEFSRHVVNVGEGLAQLLELILKVVRLVQHAGEGGTHQAQLREGDHLFFHQLPLVFLQAVRHMEDRVKALFLLRPLRLPPVLSRE